MAIGILTATGVIPENYEKKYLVMGELSLDGLIRPVKGVLPVAVTVKEMGLDGIFFRSKTPWKQP